MKLDPSYNNLAYVVDIRQGICPDGWRLPNNADWDRLSRYADGTNGTTSPYTSATAGGKLKATSGWDNDGNGTDELGFSALPSGYRNATGTFVFVGGRSYWWTASQYDNSNAYDRFIRNNNESCDYLYREKNYMLSIRCIKS